MRVRVVLKSLNPETGEEKILADGPAVLNNNTLLYREKDSGAKHRITFKDDLIIEREADVSSQTVLRDEKSGQSLVKSAYGTMELRTECMYKKRREDVWEAEYAVFSGNEQVLHQRLEWMISKI